MSDDDYALAPPAPKRPRRPAKPKTDGAVARVLARYHERFVAKWNMPPRIHGGKDGALVKRMLAAWGEPAVAGLVDTFFATTHRRVVTSDYSVGALYHVAQELLLADRKPAQDARTAENLDAALRATRRRQQG